MKSCITFICKSEEKQTIARTTSDRREQSLQLEIWRPVFNTKTLTFFPLPKNKKMHLKKLLIHVEGSLVEIL